MKETFRKCLSIFAHLLLHASLIGLHVTFSDLIHPLLEAAHLGLSPLLIKIGAHALVELIFWVIGFLVKEARRTMR